MLILLKKGKLIRKVENVVLQEAHKPTVNGESPVSDGDPEEPLKYIESALWFKTYTISAIYIDCDKRDVIWYRCDINPFNLQIEELLKSSPPNGQRLFEDVDIYDYDPIIDELIDRAINVMDLVIDGQTIQNKHFTTEVVRIIHCYILPSLHLTSLDIKNLLMASDQVESQLRLTEDDIVHKGKVVDLSSTTLDNQRHRLLKVEDMHLESYVRCCNQEFLSFFLLHIEKEIIYLDSHLMQQQQQINKFRDDKTVTIEMELRTLREKRDNAHENLKTLQIVRENIKNVISRQSKLKSTKKKFKIRQNVFHDIYCELSKRLQEQKEEMHKLVLKKLKIISVREAIKHSLKELCRERIGSNSSNPRTSFSDGSEYSIDMAGGSECRPESWMTIDDKIKKGIACCNSEISRTHRDGTSMLIEKTDAALSEMKQFGCRIECGDDLSGRSRISTLRAETNDKHAYSSNSRNSDDISLEIFESESDMQFIRNMGESSRNRRSRVQSLSESVCEDLSELSTSSLKRSINDIGQDFHKHIEKMCDLFLAYIPDIHLRHFNKLWICYETILCEQVSDKLIDLYVSVYRGPCHTLYKSLVKLSLSQFVIDDQFFRMLMRQSFENLIDFEDSNTVSSTETKLDRSDSDVDVNMVSLNSSEISFDISKCTTQELYFMADQECEKAPPQIHNSLDPTGFSCSQSLDFNASLSTDTGENSITASPGTLSSKSVEQCYKESIDKLLSPAVDFVREAIASKPLLEKLRRLTKAFRFMNDQLIKINNGENSACCDDMLTITTALILDLDCDIFTKLYATVNLLIDLKAPFLNGGVHDYCLTNFFSAYHYLFDKQVLRRRELTSTTC